MQDNSRLIMKKHLSKIALSLLLILSISCFSYLNSYEKHGTQVIQYEEISQSADRMVSSVKSASLILERVVDFLTKRQVS